MKKIKLQKLTLSNWRGQNRVVDFNDDITIIKGKNEQGKTSIMSAWFWLLSGYTDVVLPKNSNLFDDSKELSKDTPHAIVEAQVEIDGMVWMLSKKAIATFKRDKANDTWVKANSDAYIYAIDNIEMSATDFNKWIEANICPIDMLPYCLYGSFFGVLSIEAQKDARKVLEKVCGEIKREDFTGDYSMLDDMFAKGYSVEQIQESFKKQKRDIDSRLTMLPKLIDGKQEFVNVLMQNDFNKLEIEIAECKKELSNVGVLIADANSSEQEVRRARNAILAEIDSKRENIRRGRYIYLETQNTATSEIRREIEGVITCNAGIEKQNREIKEEYEGLKANLEREQSYLESLVKERDSLRNKRDETKSSIFNEEVCSACGQILPYEEQEKLREKFNKDKALRLSIIVEQGQLTSKKIEAQQAIVDELKARIEAGYKLKEPQDVEALKNELAEIERNQIDYEDTEEYKLLMTQIQELTENLPSFTVDNIELLSKQKSLMSMLEELNQKYGARLLMEKAVQEIEDMKRERTELGIQCAQLEGKLAKCDEYIQERANIVSDKVNRNLTICSIQMWDRQKNGDLVPACIVLGKNNVRLATINYANRLLVEADIQRMFCQAYDVQLPVFYDEASVFDTEHRPKKDDWQTILLQASDDPYLIVE